MYLQPFSMFFLFFYIGLITIQFLCMLWHRVSTFYHYVAQIQTNEQFAEIKSKKEHNKRSKMNAENKTEENEPKTHRQKKLMEVESREQSVSKEVFKQNRRKSTLRFADDDDSDEHFDAKMKEMQKRRSERRRSSVFTEGILFNEDDGTSDR